MKQIIGTLVAFAALAASPYPVLAAKVAPEMQQVRDFIKSHCHSDDKAKYYAPLVMRAALKYQLDPLLVASIAWHESNYRPTIVSPAGALGLMQVMGIHFKRGETWKDPQTNLYVGCRVYRGYLKRADGNVIRALMMYNAGPGGASRGWGRGYAYKVSSAR